MLAHDTSRAAARTLGLLLSFRDRATTNAELLRSVLGPWRRVRANGEVNDRGNGDRSSSSAGIATGGKGYMCREADLCRQL